MKLTKGFIDAITRDYMKFLLEEAGNAVCLEKIMEQTEQFADIQICTRKHVFSPYEFAVSGGLDSDIKEVRYGKDTEYGLLKNIICHVEEGKLALVTFDITLPDKRRVKNVTVDLLQRQWNNTKSDFLNDVIEVFEEFLKEHNIDVLNDEKTDAVRDGEDAECIASIFGSDYGWLQTEIEEVFGMSYYEAVG